MYILRIYFILWFCHHCTYGYLFLVLGAVLLWKRTGQSGCYEFVHHSPVFPWLCWRVSNCSVYLQDRCVYMATSIDNGGAAFAELHSFSLVFLVLPRNLFWERTRSYSLVDGCTIVWCCALCVCVCMCPFFLCLLFTAVRSTWWSTPASSYCWTSCCRGWRSRDTACSSSVSSRYDIVRYGAATWLWRNICTAAAKVVAKVAKYFSLGAAAAAVDVLFCFLLTPKM